MGLLLDQQIQEVRRETQEIRELRRRHTAGEIAPDYVSRRLVIYKEIRKMRVLLLQATILPEEPRKHGTKNVAWLELNELINNEIAQLTSCHDFAVRDDAESKRRLNRRLRAANLKEKIFREEVEGLERL